MEFVVSNPADVPRLIEVRVTERSLVKCVSMVRRVRMIDFK